MGNIFTYFRSFAPETYLFFALPMFVIQCALLIANVKRTAIKLLPTILVIAGIIIGFFVRFVPGEWMGPMIVSGVMLRFGSVALLGCIAALVICIPIKWLLNRGKEK